MQEVETEIPAREQARRHLEKIEHDQEQVASEARHVLYHDVEQLIDMGFLSTTIRVGGTLLALRSLGPGDQFLLQHRVGPKATQVEMQLWTIASATWMVNGMNLLEEPHAAVAVYKALQKVPKNTRNVLFSQVTGLYSRMGRALSRTEAYCYEPYSRAKWNLCGRQSPARDDYAGVPGVSRLGLNYVQRMWLAFNMGEDQRTDHRWQWQAAKMVASATSPKGVKKLNAADDRLQKQEEDRRRRVISKMVDLVLWGDQPQDDQDPWVVLVEGKPVQVMPVKRAQTPEELEDEMRRWVAGERDWHDIVVDTYKARIKAQFESEKRERESALSEVQNNPGVTGGTALVGYTLDQIREVRPDLFQGSKTQAKRVFDAQTPSIVYQRYVKEDVQPGRLMADGNKVYDTSPMGQERPSLMAQVQERSPSFSTEPISPRVVGDEG